MQEHEEALLEAISRLGEVSDGESGMTMPKHSCIFSTYQKKNSDPFQSLCSYQVLNVYLFDVGLFQFEVKFNLSPEAQYLHPVFKDEAFLEKLSFKAVNEKRRRNTYPSP